MSQSGMMMTIVRNVNGQKIMQGKIIFLWCGEGAVLWALLLRYYPDIPVFEWREFIQQANTPFKSNKAELSPLCPSSSSWNVAATDRYRR